MRRRADGALELTDEAKEFLFAQLAEFETQTRH
jgi:hypothetical protein